MLCREWQPKSWLRVHTVCHPDLGADVLILQCSVCLLSDANVHATAVPHDATHSAASLCLYAVQQLTTFD